MGRIEEKPRNISDIKKKVEEDWEETKETWKDDMSVQFQKAVINDLLELLEDIDKATGKMVTVSNEVLDKVNLISRKYSDE